MFEWRKFVHYWWSYILFSPECKELTSMLDPLLYRWGVPPVVIRCVHRTMQMWVLQTWIKAQGIAIVMYIYIYIHATSETRSSFRDLTTCSKTRQIWGIWKLRPAYSPETPNLGQNRWCFVPCDLQIWWMTLENDRASLLCCFKLCATFHSHRWIQTGATVRKRPIWVKINDF